MTAKPPVFARAGNVALDGHVPDWIELLPVGPAIQGQDGRAWTLPDPAAIVTAFSNRAHPLVVDWEHASEHRAPQGLDAPAAGWIDKLEVRDGAVWGQVTWTDKARAQIAAREYRFLSPVFVYEKAGSRIVALTSAGLTNQPNLPLTALNREDLSPMALPEELYDTLGLTVGSDTATVLAKVRALNDELISAKNRADSPPLEKFVPRADYDVVLARATNAESALAEVEKNQRQARIAALIERGLSERKIAPATADYYTAMCGYEGGIDQFETFLSKAPVLLAGDSAPAGAPPDPTPRALNRAAFEALPPAARKDHLARGGRITD